MLANTTQLNLTQHTLDQIVLGALPILQALGLELEEDTALKVKALPRVDLERLEQKVHFSGIEDFIPHVLWK